jgi:hypothetical protein
VPAAIVVSFLACVHGEEKLDAATATTFSG